MLSAEFREFARDPVAYLEDYLVGLETALTAEQYTDEARATRRAEGVATYERRKDGPSMEWLASIDGEAVAHARAFPGSRGLLLDGGATAPHARTMYEVEHDPL